MFNMGGGELILVIFLAILLIPPAKLPKVATSLGRFLGQLQKEYQEMKKSIQESAKEIKK